MRIQHVLGYHQDHWDNLTGCQHTQSNESDEIKVSGFTSLRVRYSFTLRSTLAGTSAFVSLTRVPNMAAEYSLRRGCGDAQKGERRCDQNGNVVHCANM
jgi:hypothetical protein